MLVGLRDEAGSKVRPTPLRDHIGESNEMKERPIIFSGPMVQAIIEGRKTQTRSIVKDSAWVFDGELMPDGTGGCGYEIDFKKCPYGIPGDHLWVRETWRVSESGCNEYSPSKDDVHYRADEDETSGGPWKSPLHMPRWASRITLEITDVRVQRLQEITEEDAKAEGCLPSSLVQMKDGSPCYTKHFQVIWRSIYGIGNSKSWEENPWVWALAFRAIPHSGSRIS